MELLDPTVLRALQEFRMPGEPDPAHEVARTFLAVTPERLARLHQADVDEVRRIAHQMRGSCGAVGAVAMNAVAADLEAAPHPADRSALIEQLDMLFEQTRPLLEAVVHAA